MNQAIELLVQDIKETQVTPDSIRMLLDSDMKSESIILDFKYTKSVILQLLKKLDPPIVIKTWKTTIISTSGVFH